MHEHDEVLERLKSRQDAGHRVAVATVVNTWGSSPRPVGSQLGVNDRGEMVGSVSGGCIEGAVVKEALEVMAGAPPKLLDYGVSNEQAWEVGLLRRHSRSISKRSIERRPGPASTLTGSIESRPPAGDSETSSNEGAHVQ